MLSAIDQKVLFYVLYTILESYMVVLLLLLTNPEPLLFKMVASATCA